MIQKISIAVNAYTNTYITAYTELLNFLVLHPINNSQTINEGDNTAVFVTKLEVFGTIPTKTVTDPVTTHSTTTNSHSLKDQFALGLVISSIFRTGRTSEFDHHFNEILRALK
ncbi:MAG: hypothetical protein ACFFCZ_31245 [Promethearchaeota archaeon]